MEDSANIQSSPPISSPSSSSSFEFSVARSPSSNHPPAPLCPADELFYKGQLLPLHLSPRLSLVRTLLLSSSSSTSSSDAASTTASRDSTGSSSSADSLGLLHRDSSRPSSATEEEKSHLCSSAKRRYFPSFFLKKNPTFTPIHNSSSSSSSSKKSATAHPSSPKEFIRKYLEKMKPLIEKLSSLQNRAGPQQKKKSFSLRRGGGGRTEILSSSQTCSRSLAENYLRSPYRRRSAASCPSSMRSSPSHSRLLSSDLMSAQMSSSSSMEELQSAIQAAIAHCKSTMAKQKKSMAAASSLEDDICVF